MLVFRGHLIIRLVRVFEVAKPSVGRPPMLVFRECSELIIHFLVLFSAQPSSTFKQVLFEICFYFNFIQLFKSNFVLFALTLQLLAIPRSSTSICSPHQSHKHQSSRHTTFININPLATPRSSTSNKFRRFLRSDRVSTHLHLFIVVFSNSKLQLN